MGYGLYTTRASAINASSIRGGGTTDSEESARSVATNGVIRIEYWRLGLGILSRHFLQGLVITRAYEYQLCT